MGGTERRELTSSRIAILGWGSLLWEDRPEFGRWHDGWKFDGPSSALEFSRISTTRLRALTLVIDPQHGSLTTVGWSQSKRSDPRIAVADLRGREGCRSAGIGCLEVPRTRANSSRHEEAIAVWATQHDVDVVVWTALESNFESETGKPFSIGEAIVHLRGLEGTAMGSAVEYVRRAPDFVRTPLRTAFQSEPWFQEFKAG